MADRIRTSFEIPAVEQAGVAEEVWELATNTVKPKSAKAISEILHKKGIEISWQTIKRWLAKQRKKMIGETRDLLADHIIEHLPNDLNALEEIEGRALTNARMKAIYKSHEMANEGKFIEHFLDRWAPVLKKCKDPQELRNLTKEILSQCFKWVFESIDWDKNVRNEAKIALTAIDMKLKYTTQLHGAGSGNINIMDGSAKTGDDSGGDGTSLPQTAAIEVKAEEEGAGKLRIIKRSPK